MEVDPAPNSAPANSNPSSPARSTSASLNAAAAASISNRMDSFFAPSGSDQDMDDASVSDDGQPMEVTTPSSSASSSASSTDTPVDLLDPASKVATAGALVYFLSTLEVLGFTKTAGTASGPADDEPIDQLNLHKLIKLIKPHLCRKIGKHPIFCNEAEGNKQGGAPTAGSIANAFAAHRDQLGQDEVLGQHTRHVSGASASEPAAICFHFAPPE